MFSLCINSRLSLNFLLETASLGISATVTNLNVHNCLPFFFQKHTFCLTLKNTTKKTELCIKPLTFLEH